jgi:DNA replication protein DnaC
MSPFLNYSFLNDAPPFLFFTGKGGVGKTSLACASAVAMITLVIPILNSFVQKLTYTDTYC